MATKKSGKIGATVRLHLNINLKALAEEFIKRYHDYELRPEWGGGELEVKNLNLCRRNLENLGLILSIFPDTPKDIDTYVLRDAINGTKIIWVGIYEIGFTSLKFARLVKKELKTGSDGEDIKIYKEIE